MIKVVAVNGSPRKEKGSTAKILSPFLEGMRRAGASVDLFYAKDLAVRPCEGEFYCWFKKPGTCHIRDGMQQMYPRLREANILVLATPVHVPLPGEMQNFVNRIVPLMNPTMRREGGRTRAQFRDDVKIGKIALVSSCAWWEKANFDTVVRIARELASDVNVEFAGALLRPHSSLLVEGGEKTERILRAAEQAGYVLIKEGRIPEDLVKIVGQPLVSYERFLKGSD